MSTVERYGLNWDEGINDLRIEAWCYKNKHPEDKGGLGQAGHFKNIAQILWGPQNKRKQFIWHPWAEIMNEAVHRYEVTAFSGCGSSGKSDYAAIWCIINWLVDPRNTLCLQTSTSLRAARGRIWGATTEYFRAAGGLPGKLTDSDYTIRTRMDDGELAKRAGIWLIAAEQKQEKEAVEKIIGLKNKRIRFAADELPDISPAVPSAFFANLSTNDDVAFLGLGNFKNRYDAFGELIKPKAGWDSINIDSEEWETDRGICVRFDGMKSPNFKDGDRWPIYGSKHLERQKKNLGGDKSPLFWRMCRSWEVPLGTEMVIYDESDLVSGGAYEQNVIWLEPPTKISSLDPSYTNGGDRTAQMIGSFGKTNAGLWVMKREKTLLLYADVTKKRSRDYQIVDQFRANCEREGVLPEYAALDVTGAGTPLYSIVAEEWSPKVVPVNFSGSPSDMLIRANDSTTAKQQFDRRVSELWWVGREFMRFQQIRGMDEETARELKARKYDHRKGPDGLKIVVESKPDMKIRINFSPDLGDAWALLIELCRQRFGWLAGGLDTGMRAVETDFNAELQAVNDMYANVSYAEEVA